MPKFNDLSGNKYGYLTALKKIAGGKNAVWECACLCGNSCNVAACHLKSGHTKSCGCHKVAVLNKGTNLRHGRSINKDRTYKTWKEMRQRCNNEKKDNWKWYGNRGISVCTEWESFEQFLSDMGERPIGFTLDRIDVDGDYEKSNCRWATPKQQATTNRGCFKKGNIPHNKPKR